MREYGKVSTRFWQSLDMRAMSDAGKMTALYLLTCAHGNILGNFYLPIAYMAADIGTVTETVAKGLKECCERGFCAYDDRRQWVWIKKFLEWNPLENPNQWVSARKVATEIPHDVDYLNEFIEFFNGCIASEGKAKVPLLANPLVNRSATLSKSGTGTGTGTGTGERDSELPLIENSSRKKNGTYRWEGKIIKLNETDYEERRKTFHKIDLDAELLAADAYFSQESEAGKNWFFRLTNWLKKAHAEAPNKTSADRAPREGGEIV